MPADPTIKIGRTTYGPHFWLLVSVSVPVLSAPATTAEHTVAGAVSVQKPAKAEQELGHFTKKLFTMHANSGLVPV